MKIDNYLENLIKQMKGSLIGIGINNEKIIDIIDKNKNILECNLLDCYIPKSTDNSMVKKINNKRLRRKFKKHHTDNIICNLNNIKEFKERFIYDSIYIGKNKIYIFSTEDAKENLRRYKRFGIINLIKCSNGFIYEINITKKINKTNEIYYKFIDFILDGIDIIGNILSDS